MSEIKKYLNEEGLRVVASEINTKLTQYTIMPTASADYTSKIIQYIGNSTNTYTQGFFYTSIIDDATADPVTYKWQEIELGGDTLTFNDNDFDVDNNTVALSATQRIFKGTQAEWDALSEDEQAVFTVRYHPDEGTGDVADAVTDGDTRAVSSNAVYDALNASITDLTADETAVTYEDYTVETLGAHMYQVGRLCWVHIDIRVTYTGEVALDTDGHKDFWSNKFSIPDFDDVSEWYAIPCFGYVSNSHRRFEITLNNFGVTGGQKAIAFRLRHGEDEPIYTGDVFNLRCVCCFAKA